MLHHRVRVGVIQLSSARLETHKPSQEQLSREAESLHTMGH